MPIASVEVDAQLWDAVRLAVPVAARRVGPATGGVFPVIEQDGRLVLLAFFEEFLALVAAGATSVSIWPAEFEEGDDLVEYAVASSMR